jgi:surface antigen
MFGQVLRLASAALTGAMILALTMFSILPPREEATPASAPPVSAPVPAAAPETIRLASAILVDPALEVAAPRIDRSGPPLECAIYARDRTGVDLSGDARTWWAQAAGKYKRSHIPAPGAIFVMGGTEDGHVGVVAKILSARDLLMDHANWLGKGEIETGALVHDVSPANDWSQVRVWYPPSNGLGLKPYPGYGFILPDGVEMAALP